MMRGSNRGDSSGAGNGIPDNQLASGTNAHSKCGKGVVRGEALP